MLARYEQAAKLCRPSPGRRYRTRRKRFIFAGRPVSVSRSLAGARLPAATSGGPARVVHIAQCRTGAEGPGCRSTSDGRCRATAGWRGGSVAWHGCTGPQIWHALVAFAGRFGTPARARRPSIASIPNNHLLYAIQWFIFAVIALVIYVLALRRRSAGRRKPEGQRCRWCTNRLGFGPIISEVEMETKNGVGRKECSRILVVSGNRATAPAPFFVPPRSGMVIPAPWFVEALKRATSPLFTLLLPRHRG